MILTKKDVFWNYAATFLKIASSALLFPFILRMMPSEMVGIWTVFITITAFASLLDFGFNPSFSRNVTYIFSGVKTLQIKGFELVDKNKLAIDYGLLKGVISAMRWFYSRIAIALFLILVSFGTLYINTLLKNYKGEKLEVYIAWTLLCIISTYNLYTLYYDSLLYGKGLVKRSKQIIIIGHTVYLFMASILIMAGYGLIAIVAAQASSVIIVRWLSYRSFFTKEMKQNLHSSPVRPKNEILTAITPNALKIGLTSLGGFMVQQSAIILGSLYLSLEEIASFGITFQLIFVIAGLGGIYTASYQPKIVQLRVENNSTGIKKIYLKGQIIMVLTFILGGIGLLILGEWGLNFIHSQTKLLPRTLVLVAIIISLLETNHATAGGILLTKNEVPFFKAAILSGIMSILLLLIFLKYTNFGLWGLVLAPGISQLVYQNWKWPSSVIKDLKITLEDVYKTFNTFIKFN